MGDEFAQQMSLPGGSYVKIKFARNLVQRKYAARRALRDVVGRAAGSRPVEPRTRKSTEFPVSPTRSLLRLGLMTIRASSEVGSRWVK